MNPHRLAFVTGGSRGIGNAIVQNLREDHEVIAPGRSELDLANLNSISTFLERHSSLCPDLLVINAAENFPKPISETSNEDLMRTLTVNFASAYVLMREFGRRMSNGGSGRIVAISSCYSQRSRPGRSLYSSTKAALDSLVRTASLELAAHGVLVNGVAPGFVATELTFRNNDEESLARIVESVPLGRLADAKEIAEIVRFLGSNRNTYITGQVIPVDGGFLCR